MMHSARTLVMLCLVLAAGCAGVKQLPPVATAPGDLLRIDPSLAGPRQESAIAVEPPRAATVAEAVALKPVPAAALQPATSRVEASDNEAAAAAGAQAPPAASQRPAKAVQPAAKAPAKVSVSSAAIEPIHKIATPAPAAKTPEPSLDVAALKARLRDTNAIGMFTKLALKNQVDDLLKQFRAHYLNGQKTSVAALRQPYDMLVLKVLALLQDSDPSLARSISGSREAIWGILADPEKFSSVS